MREKWFGRQLHKGLFVLLIGCVLFSISGCSALPEDSTGHLLETEVDIPEDGTVQVVEKEVPSEDNLRDKMGLYEGADDTSVIKMYLTVSRGNEADNSDNTWTEVNTYSAYDYEAWGVDRYKVEGILQIDEGQGITADSFGAEEIVPNVTVQVRGQTSSRGTIKNYKIRIKDGKGSFHDQTTINLNKHSGDPFRFTNKLCYSMLDSVPQLLGGRTRFVQLYVCDTTEGGNGTFQDYGLYTMVEQVNKRYLRNRGLDENGQLYKVTFFEWNQYDAVSVPMDSPEFDQDAFDTYLEIKGDYDNSLLNEVVQKVNNRMIPIEEIVDKHFDAENICYWMAFNILVGNYDSGARNLFLYSPLNSERFYMICWDLDSSFRKTYNAQREVIEGLSWEQGMSQYLGLTLVNRMMKEEKYRDMLAAAVEDLHDHYVNKEIVDAYAEAYSSVARDFLYGGADSENGKLEEESFDQLIGELGEEVEKNYEFFWYNQKLPWPFFVGLLQVDGDHMIINWDASYDVNGESVTYDYVLATDYEFLNVIEEGYELVAPSATIHRLPPGVYYLRVRATNESGFTQDCFDYYSVKGGQKVYACAAFEVFEDGTSEPYTGR